MTQESIYGKTLFQIKEICENLSLPKYAAVQIADWLYKKHCTSINEMSNLSKSAREVLNNNFFIDRVSHSHEQTSADGTKKYLFPVQNQKYIEAVYIPESDRATLCVSSQVGCKMACSFCMTGKQGFQGQLTSEEVLNQISSLPEREKLTNIVYMGMGEPFDNMNAVLESLEILTSEWGFAMSPRRITVSTIGILPGIKQFMDESNCHLAVSLHSPFESERKKLMPVENKYSVKEIIDTLWTYDFQHQRRLSFEYILLKGINDSLLHVKELIKLLSGLNCRINLIRYHSVPGAEFTGSDEETVQLFSSQLNKKGITTTVRASRGEDIMAACGLLSTDKGEC